MTELSPPTNLKHVIAALDTAARQIAYYSAGVEDARTERGVEMSTEHTILVAFTVEADTRAEAHAALQRRLVPTLRSEDATSPVESWWIAEDDRADGSDCDPAVFVDPGKQAEALRLLWLAGMTSICNMPRTPWGNPLCVVCGEGEGIMCPDGTYECCDCSHPGYDHDMDPLPKGVRNADFI